MSRFKSLYFLLLFLTIILVFPETVNAQDTHRIGLCVPITGSGADAGKREVIGAQVAVNEINAKGGIGGTKFASSWVSGGGWCAWPRALAPLLFGARGIVKLDPLASECKLPKLTEIVNS